MEGLVGQAAMKAVASSGREALGIEKEDPKKAKERQKKISKAVQKEDAIRARMADERTRKAAPRKDKQAELSQHMREKYGMKSWAAASGSSTATCAWLLKRGRVNKAFKRRWFQLDGLAITYFENPDSEIQSGSIDISFGTKLELREQDGQHELLIHSASGRIYVLRSESNFLRHLVEWQTAIEEQQLKLKFT